jgi:hypothetical protein
MIEILINVLFVGDSSIKLHIFNDTRSLAANLVSRNLPRSTNVKNVAESTMINIILKCITRILALPGSSQLPDVKFVIRATSEMPVELNMKSCVRRVFSMYDYQM